MKKIKFLIILIVVFLWVSPNAYAFLKDDGQSSDEGNLIQDMMHKNAYNEMVNERRKKSKEAAIKRKKRNATLTPFIHDTPEEFADLSRWNKNIVGKKSSPKPSPKETSPSSVAKKGILGNLSANVLAIAACFVGFIFLSRYLRTKK